MNKQEKNIKKYQNFSTNYEKVKDELISAGFKNNQAEVLISLFYYKPRLLE